MQHNITLKNISKSYPTKTLFSKASLSVSTRDRVALVGDNGCGKSTLLRIIAGLESVDEGGIEKDRSEIIYLAQEFSGDDDISILDYLERTNAKSQVFTLLKQFGILSVKQIETMSMSELSGGQKRIVEIAAVLSRSPKWICIDEPENHLDIVSRQVLIDLLKNYWGGVLLVSHDRHLINQLANKIARIKDESIEVVSDMSYEEFLDQQRRQTLNDISRYTAESKAIAVLRESVALLQRRAKVNSGIATTYQMKKRELERRELNLGPKPQLESAESHIVLTKPSKKVSRILFSTENMSFGYDERLSVLEQVTVQMNANDKVVLLGRNGSGKSTFFDLLQKKIEPTSGTCVVASGARFGYLQQEHDLLGSDTPLDVVRLAGVSEEQARSMLAQILFTRYESEGLIQNLSGGQVQRLRFLLLFVSQPDCIVLDEPTNNLDPTTWDVLVRLLNEFAGSLLLVSHDRAFLEVVEHTQLWTLSNKRIRQSWKPLDEVVDNL